MNFIELKKAYDSVHRESIWSIVRGYRIPQRYVNISRKLYINSSFCVRTDNGNADFFNIETRVRQGCILPPLLFILVVDFVMRKVTKERNIDIQRSTQTRLNDLDFADDIVLLAETTECLQHITTKLEKAAGKVSLRINKDKIKTMRR
jgi:hypothetical protein